MIHHGVVHECQSEPLTVAEGNRLRRIRILLAGDYVKLDTRHNCILGLPWSLFDDKCNELAYTIFALISTGCSVLIWHKGRSVFDWCIPFFNRAKHPMISLVVWVLTGAALGGVIGGLAWSWHVFSNRNIEASNSSSTPQGNQSADEKSTAKDVLRQGADHSTSDNDPIIEVSYDLNLAGCSAPHLSMGHELSAVAEMLLSDLTGRPIPERRMQIACIVPVDPRRQGAFQF